MPVGVRSAALNVQSVFFQYEGRYINFNWGNLLNHFAPNSQPGGVSSILHVLRCDLGSFW